MTSYHRIVCASRGTVLGCTDFPVYDYWKKLLIGRVGLSERTGMYVRSLISWQSIDDGGG
ncbi:MAG: hypothetical protein II766_00215 [Paludibacteraceae bacterium]|nr:hypothetical protein [Paludibacteraceae bacterium]